MQKESVSKANDTVKRTKCRILRGMSLFATESNKATLLPDFRCEIIGGLIVNPLVFFGVCTLHTHYKCL